MNKISFPPGAEEYYNVNAARKFLEGPVPEGYVRWRCVLCGYPQGDFKKDHPDYDIIGACCCGGCGQTCCRPIDEYPQHKDEG